MLQRLSDVRVEPLQESPQPCRPVMLVGGVIEPWSVGQVERDLKGAGADAFTEQLDADIAAQLEAGHDVAYNALVTREGLAMRRIPGSPEEIVGGMLAADDAGVTSSQFTTTEEGFAVRAINVTTKELSP